jgi:tetratricopeptide (TPR) repeat protein
MSPHPDCNPEDAAPDAVEELMVECLGGSHAEEAERVEAACVRHPQLAAALQRRFAHLGAMGLGPVPQGAEPLPERLGEFRLIERLGAGGMGVVYRALQEPLQREVAVKVIRPERLYFPGSRALFRREVEAVARMHHPGIVPIHLVGEERGIPFYAMELVRGRTLAVALSECRGRSTAELDGRDLAPGSPRGWVDTCCELVRQLALALAHAHAHGVVHRDIKPSNIMVREDGCALLLDFGLASHDGGERLTRTGSQPGSLAYMSPEQVRGERVDARTDVYSLGVTLYEMLTLTPAFSGDTEAAVRARIERGEVVPMTVARRGIAWDVATVCATAMAPERPQRYGSATELAADLQAILARRPIAARRPGVGLRLRRFVQRRPTLATAAGLGALLLFGAPAALHLQEYRARAAIEQEAEIARQVTAFLVDLFGHATPEFALGEDLRVRTLVDLARARLGEGPTPPARVRVELLETLGKVYAGLGRHEEAGSLLHEARELRRGALHQSGASLADATEWLGHLALARGDPASAETEFDAALALQDHGSPDPLRRANILAALGEVHLRREQPDRARAFVDDALQAARSALPAESQGLANVLHRAGRVLLEAEGPRAAEPLLRDAVAMLDRAWPVDRLEKTLPLSSLGHCLFQLGRRNEAAPLLQRALELALRYYGTHPVTVGIQVQNAGLLVAVGEMERAEALLRDALHAGRATLRGPDARLARAEAQLGLVLGLRGRFADAAVAFERALAQYRELGGSESGAHLETAFTFGKLLLSAGRTTEAEAQLRTALQLGGDPPRARMTILAMARASLARALSARGQFAEAMAQAARGVAELRMAGDAAIRELGSALADQAQVLIQAGQGANAGPVAEELVALLERLGPLGEQRLSEALCLRSAAREMAGALAQARADGAAALTLARRLFEAKSPLLVAPLRQAAHLASLDGDPEHAVELLREATALARSSTSGTGETYGFVLTCYARACLDAGNLADAGTHALDSLQVQEAAQVTGGPAAVALVEVLARLLQQGVPGVDPERVRSLAGRWLPPNHVLRAGLAPVPEPAASSSSPTQRSR